jgi:C4-dicarboxylate transporter DctQ subunit
VLRNALHRLEESLLVLILTAMTLLTFVQVVLRYVFNTGIMWALEATTYMFGWLVLLGMSYCVRVRAHIGVDAAIRLLSPGWRRALGLFVLVLTLVYTGLMLYGALVYIEKLQIIGVEAEDIPIQRWILSLCVPIGFALLGVRLLEMGWRILTGQSPGYELADEAAEAMRELPHEHGASDPGGVR